MRYWHPGPDGILKIGSFFSPSRDNENFIDHKWLTTTDVHRLIALSDQETMEGNHKQCIYIFEGVDATSAALGSPIALELKQQIPIRLDTTHLSAESIVAYSKGNVKSSI
jgi:hypothetical protein